MEPVRPSSILPATIKRIGEGGSSPVECIKAGNDLIVPGAYENMELIREALHGSGAETLDLKEVKKCVTRLTNIILQSNKYKDCISYAEQFQDMKPFVECYHET